MKEPRVRPRNGFLLETQIKRQTPKSAFLKKLERAQKQDRDNVVEILHRPMNVTEMKCRR